MLQATTRTRLKGAWSGHKAAASAIAEVPGRLEKTFHNSELNSAGIYAVDFWALGVPHTVVVDDYLPLKETSTGSY